MSHLYDNVLIAIPNGGWVRADLIQLLSRLLMFGANVYAPTGFKPCPRARNECVKTLLAGKREWLWFIDHDVLPPEGALDLLLHTHERAITGVVPTMKPQDEGGMRPTPLTAKRDPAGEMRAYMGHGVEPIERCGAGCWLLHRSVFEQIEPPWFEDRVWQVGEREPTGQDFVFCEKMEVEGIQLYAHFDVVCRHKKEVDL